MRLGRQLVPPLRQISLIREMQGQLPELPRIPKHQSRLRTANRQVIMLALLAINFAAMQRACHAEMSLQKRAPAKREKHSLSMCVSSQQSHTIKGIDQSTPLKQSTATSLPMQPSQLKTLPTGAFPNRAMIKDFSEFRHESFLKLSVTASDSDSC